jgi:hypothetical protein
MAWSRGRPSAIAIALCMGCAPQINRFEMSPKILCEGDEAVIGWDVRGEPSLTIKLEPPAQDAACPRSGFDVYAVTLVAKRGGHDDAVRTLELGQEHATSAEPVAVQTQQLSGNDVVGSGDKDVGLWGSRLKVVTISACDGRNVKVTHGGKTASLVAGGPPSRDFEGTDLSGSWELRSPLSPEEITTPSKRPKDIRILATLRCAPETR